MFYVCRFCNRYKSAKQAAKDPLTGIVVNLFHPLRQKWGEHFAWDESNTLIVGLTASGRATVLALQTNNPTILRARRRHYDGVHPDDFAKWFLTFHEPFYEALKPTGSLVINIKDRVVNGVRHRYVWHMIEALGDKGWYSIEDYLWHKTNPMAIGRIVYETVGNTVFILPKRKNRFLTPMLLKGLLVIGWRPA